MEAAANFPLALIAPPTPLSSMPCASCPLVPEVLDLRGRANYWETCFRKAKEREQRCQEEIEQLKAENRSLEQRLRGRKSEKQPGLEKGPGKTESGKTSQPKRGRGQQPNNPGPSRRLHEHLPVEDEVVDLPEDQRLCAGCGKAFAAMEQTDDGEILEVDVQAHRRRYHRKRYVPPAIATSILPWSRRRHPPS